jgi:hypothetical protein
MVDRWTNPTTASLRGEDSRPLQQTFSSLSSYLEKLDNAITAAAASGVSSLSAGTGIGLSGGTGAVTVSNTGVTSLAGTANQITVSAGTGGVTLSLPQNIHTGAVPTFGGLVSNGNVTVPVTSNSFFSDSNGSNFWRPVDIYGNSYFRLSSGSWYSDSANYYFRNASSANVTTIDSSGNMTVTGQLRSITGGAGGGLVMRTWTANASYVSLATNNMSGQDYVLLTDGTTTFIGSANGGSTYIRSSANNTSGQLRVLPGGVEVTGYLAVGTSLTYNGHVSCNNWFRSTGGSGWYQETYGGGIWMTDSTWVRVYNNKAFYVENELRTGNVFSGNGGRSRGSYGAISIGGNGITNTWDGIEFASAQTFMIQGAQYSGVYRNNNEWNWLFSYSGLIIGSDERYKRDIQPLGLGLNFIEHLQPVSFLKLTEDPDDDPEATEPDYYYGFTAQNVRAALDAVGETRDVKIHNIGGPNMGLVACTEDAVYDRQYIGINEFIAPLVQAVKELNSRVKQLEQGAISQ